MDDYITKPLKAAHIRQMIERWSPARSDTPPPPQPDTVRAEAEPPADEPPAAACSVDVEAALERLGDDRELLAMALSTFIESMPELLGQIREALAASDAERLQLSAHTLKGAAANVGAAQASGVACQLERMGSEGRLADAGPLVRHLEGHLDSLKTFVQAYVKG
jgi:HPt (histidine-containing phosphotransfer) domain-containing protein